MNAGNRPVLQGDEATSAASSYLLAGQAAFCPLRDPSLWVTNFLTRSTIILRAVLGNI
jgi:hypothetical protein